MPLTYDQKSEIRIAFDEAYVPADRRRDLRVKYRVDAEICSWRNCKQGAPFTVRIEDFSPSGVGVIHGAPLDLGSEYLIKVPRPNFSDLIVLLSVVRCKQLEDGSHLIGMELSSVMDRTHLGQLVNAVQTSRRDGNRRLRWLVIMFGIVSIAASLLMQ